MRGIRPTRLVLSAFHSPRPHAHEWGRKSGCNRGITLVRTVEMQNETTETIRIKRLSQFGRMSMNPSHHQMLDDSATARQNPSSSADLSRLGLGLLGGRLTLPEAVLEATVDVLEVTHAAGTTGASQQRCSPGDITAPAMRKATHVVFLLLALRPQLNDLVLAAG
jgi:hypothetical protein